MMHGQLLVLLSDTLLPLFIFNNGMNLISKPLIIPNNQAIFAYAYVFGDFQAKETKPIMKTKNPSAGSLSTLTRKPKE